jgi:3-oxoadipate enol-lactonase
LTRIAHDRRGSGPPVVLTHGLGGTSDGIWGRVAGELEDEFTVVTYDLRGTGGSERVAGPYSLDDFVGDLRALIEELDLASPALVGHSFGGSIGLAYAARHPDEVSAVVSVGGPVVLPEQGQQGMRDRAEKVENEGMASVAETVATNGTAPSFRERDPDGFEALVAMLAANDPASYAATCHVLAELDLRPDLGRVTAPVLLVAGDRDGVVPPAAGDEIEAALPNAAPRVTVEDCGHNLTVERPGVLLEEVRAFLRGRVTAPA